MNAAIVGNSRAGKMTSSIVRGFLQAGTRAELVPYMLPSLHRPGIRGSGAADDLVRLVWRPLLESRLLGLLRRMRPDLVLFVKCDDLHRSVYRRIRAACGAPLVAFHPDDPFRHGTRMRPGPVHPRSRTQIREVDLYAIWSRLLFERALREGAQRGMYLPFACDPELYPRLEPTDSERSEFGADVTFVGNWDAERERWLRPIAALGVDFAVWGDAYWGTRCRDAGVRDAWRGRPLIGRDMSLAMVSSKINLNILREQNKNACNMRTFEIPCVGGFMLHERSSDLGGLFPPGEACSDFGSEEELARKVRHYLAHPEERERIVAAGHRAALRQTYRQWAERVLDALGQHDLL